MPFVLFNIIQATINIVLFRNVSWSFLYLLGCMNWNDKHCYFLFQKYLCALLPLQPSLCSTPCSTRQEPEDSSHIRQHYCLSFGQGALYIVLQDPPKHLPWYHEHHRSNLMWFHIKNIHIHIHTYTHFHIKIIALTWCGSISPSTTLSLPSSSKAFAKGSPCSLKMD